MFFSMKLIDPPDSDGEPWVKLRQKLILYSPAASSIGSQPMFPLNCTIKNYIFLSLKSFTQIRIGRSCYISCFKFSILRKIIEMKVMITNNWKRCFLKCIYFHRNKQSFLQYLSLFWPVQQSRAAIEPNFKPVTKYTYQLIYISLYKDMYMAMHQSSYGL